MLDPIIFRLAAIIHEERLAEAAQARRWATRASSQRLRDRVRLALSDRLIALGQHVRPPTAPDVARS
jgi:hypothetical protein